MHEVKIGLLTSVQIFYLELFSFVIKDIENARTPSLRHILVFSDTDRWSSLLRWHIHSPASTHLPTHAHTHSYWHTYTLCTLHPCTPNTNTLVHVYRVLSLVSVHSGSACVINGCVNNEWADSVHPEANCYAQPAVIYCAFCVHRVKAFSSMNRSVYYCVLSFTGAKKHAYPISIVALSSAKMRKPVFRNAHPSCVALPVIQWDVSTLL